MNSRIDGINRMLRKQEDPPRVFTGSGSINQAAVSKLKKPGGYFVESSPTLKIESLAVPIPQDVWASLHELERMYNDMAGFAPVLQGRGESGVRAQGHAETLTRNASPRFKDRALLIERQVAAVGSLGLDIMKVHHGEKLTAWVTPHGENLETLVPGSDPTLEPPVPGQKPIEFLLSQLDPDSKVTVDSHSSSPAFSYETRALLFDLVKIGAASPEAVIAHTHPPGEDSMIAELETKKVEQAEFLKAHPELSLKSIRGGKNK